MKKIVHICMNSFTDEMAYQENLLTKYHAKLGYAVTVITSTWKYDTEGRLIETNKRKYINKDNVSVRRLELIGKNDIKKKFRKFKDLYRTLCEESPDILFIHCFQYLDILVIARYIKDNKVKQVYVDNHADYANSATTWLSKNILHKVIWKYCVKKIEPYTKKFYGVTPARVDILHELYGLPKKKCELLVMGVDDELAEMAEQSDTKRNIRKQYHIENDDFLIVTGGKIDQWKVQTLLLEKAIIRMNQKNVKLLIFGSVISELKEQVLSMCNENIQYIGWLSVEDSYKVIGAADLAVYPGGHSILWEQTAGQGIPMLVKHWEGTHHMDVGGNVEFLYKDSLDEMYDKIRNLFNNKEKYLKMKETAYKDTRYFRYSYIAEKSIEKCSFFS